MHKGRFRISTKGLAFALGLPSNVDIRISADNIQDVFNIIVVSSESIPGVTFHVPEGGSIPEIHSSRRKLG